jgi:hypothetical protein
MNDLTYQYFSTINHPDQRRQYLRNLLDGAKTSKYDPDFLLDNFSPFVPTTAFIRSLVRYELFKLIIDIPGTIVECGVFSGHGMFSLLHSHFALEPENIYRRFVGFDTFEGFPSIDEKLDGDYLKPTQHRFDELDLLNFLNQAHQNFWPEYQQVKLDFVKGDAVTTIPKWIDENPAFLCALLYLDFDLYHPTLAALTHIVPRMQSGAVIAFDELGFEKFPGETQAFFDWAGGNKFQLLKLPFSKVTYIKL